MGPYDYIPDWTETSNPYDKEDIEENYPWWIEEQDEDSRMD